ncbi:MAG: alkaline shock response membrane anchor protein AmaP [Clostridiales bacterium]|nr:alkaline shock response membrane anchor protein AmaP [Clostridiales bacterium]
MKIKVFDRVLLALYALLGLAALACLALNALPLGFTLSIDGLTNALAGRPAALVAAIAAGVVFLAWTIRLLMVAFMHGPRYDHGSVSIQNTENGAVRVSVAAMDALVKQAIGQSDGVVDLKTRIINHEDSITVKIDMTLASDAHIPNVTMLMQRNIKSFIEEFSGIAVREVEIMVTSIQQVERPVPALVDRRVRQSEEPVVRPAPTIYAEGPVYPEDAEADEIDAADVAGELTGAAVDGMGESAVADAADDIAAGMGDDLVSDEADEAPDAGDAAQPAGDTAER